MDNNTDNDGSPLALDRFGNATGGVRNTYVDVPVARIGVPNVGKTPEQERLCSLGGFEVAFSTSELQALYDSPREYRQAVRRRLNRLIRQGWFLPEFKQLVLEDARQVQFPRAPRSWR